METAEKKAFVFDTNFIIQTKALNEVIQNLSDRFSVYVTQVSVEERIAQECRRVISRYRELDVLKEKFDGIATITITKPCEKEQETYRNGMQRKYNDTFKDHLIPFAKDADMFSAVLERAYNKKPPFLSEDNASDKGFKDALIWESILLFFKDNGENEVLLITDDNGFSKNADSLCAEFSEVTGKTLSIHPNVYYRELLKPELVEEPTPPPPIANVEKLREKIHSVIYDICYVESEDSWGNPISCETFVLNKQVDSTYAGVVFENLKKTRDDHLFEINLPASAFLELDDRITDTDYLVPMTAIDNAVKLYDEMTRQYPDYFEQFLAAAVSILNQNYRDAKPANIIQELADMDGELPF